MQNKKDPRQFNIDIPEVKKQGDPEEEIIVEEKPEYQKNDAGEDISVDNGYSPADVEELARLKKEEDEMGL